jgi:hypothetical protein
VIEAARTGSVALFGRADQPANWGQIGFARSKRPRPPNWVRFVAEISRLALIGPNAWGTMLGELLGSCRSGLSKNTPGIIPISHCSVLEIRYLNFIRIILISDFTRVLLSEA